MTTNYLNLKKKFYKEHKRVEQRSWDEIDKFLNLHQIKFSGFDLPKPIFTIDEINFPDYIAEELRMQGISRPTAIQSMTWPALYSGRDLMCIGLPTHSRVISYICPALVFIKEQEMPTRKSGPLVLIVTQTKEVAKEILTQSQMFMQQAQCSFCCLFDDENINTQSLQLREHEHDILIGNYHRMCELLDNNSVNLANVSFLIMDDFYRNRSARLSDEIKRVVNETRTDRLTAIFSRIVPSGLQKSNGDEFQNDAVFICVGNDDIHVSNKELPQSIHICTMAEKKKKLQDIITEISEKEKNFKILVYANGFKKIRITEKIIKELGIDTFAYERTNVGRRRRAMKEKVYYNFNATPNSVLVASDVVSSKVELPDLNYIINADFPVNLSLYLNRMRMSNVKKYISLFIAEDARHADRLIYVLNECRQEVPPILYKISEAYINSGKDVDRMPSLQEINEGLTKPVEKPIPKPLPPTISIEETGALTVATSINSPNKTVVSAGSSSSQSQISPPLESTRVSPSPSFTSAVVSTSMKQSTPKPIHSTPTLSSSQTFKKFKSFHNSFPPPPVSMHQHQASSSFRQSLNTVPFNNSINSYSHHQNQLYSNNQSSSESFQSIPLNNVNLIYRPQVQSQPQVYSYPSYPHQAPIYNYQTNHQVPYYTSNSYYTINQNGGYYVLPNTAPIINGINNNQFSSPSNQHSHLIASSSSVQMQPQYFTNQSQQPGMVIQSANTNGTYHQVENVQNYQQYQTGQIQTQKNDSQIKNEPIDANIIMNRTNASNGDSNNKMSNSNENLPYFTNPIPFKQEPNEMGNGIVQTHNENSSIINGVADQKDDDSNAISIVNHLLKDKQILSQLEKVAKSFSHSSGSLFQGTWNFPPSSS